MAPHKAALVLSLALASCTVSLIGQNQQPAGSTASTSTPFSVSSDSTTFPSDVLRSLAAGDLEAWKWAAEVIKERGGSAVPAHFGIVAGMLTAGLDVVDDRDAMHLVLGAAEAYSAPPVLLEYMVEAKLRLELRHQGYRESEIDSIVTSIKDTAAERALQSLSIADPSGLLQAVDPLGVMNSAAKQGITSVTGGSAADAIDAFLASSQTQQLTGSALSFAINTSTAGSLVGTERVGQFVSSEAPAPIVTSALTAGFNTATGGAVAEARRVGDFVASGQAQAVIDDAATAGFDTATEPGLLDIVQKAKQKSAALASDHAQLSQSVTEVEEQIQGAQRQQETLQGQDEAAYQQARNSISILQPSSPVAYSGFNSDSEVTGWDVLQDVINRFSQPANLASPKQQGRNQSAAPSASQQPRAQLDCSFLNGYAAGCLQSCMYLACLGGCDAAAEAQCHGDYSRQLAWEHKAMAECKAGYPVQVPAATPQPPTKSK